MKWRKGPWLHRHFWQTLGGRKVRFDVTETMVFASVDGQRIAASPDWGRWAPLTGRHDALLRELNRPDRHLGPPGPARPAPRA